MALNNLGLGFTITARDQASQVFQGVGRELGGLSQQGDKASTSMQEAAGALKSTGTKMMAVGSAGLVGFAMAAREAAAFGTAVSEVSTLVDESVFPMQRMDDLSRSMAEQFGGDASAQARALYQTISAGVSDAEKATLLLTDANKLAIGGVTDVTTAVDALTNAVNTFGKDGLTSGQAADAMFVAIKAGKTTAGELAHTLGRVGSTSASLGVTFDQTAAAIAAITTKGIQTSEAVSGLKAAFANILQPSKDASDEAKRLGISFDAASMRAQGLPKFLKSITSSANFNADTFARLFGSVEAYNAVLALTANDSSTFNSILDQMRDKTGAAQGAFDKMSDTADFASTLLGSKFKVALIGIGKAIQPIVSKLVAFATMVVDRFNAIPEPIRGFIAVLGAAASGALVVGGAFLALVGTVAGLTFAGGALILALKIVGVALLAVGALLAPLILLGAGLYIAWTRNLGGLATKVTEWAGKVKLAFQAISQLFSSGAFSGAVLTELNKAGNEGVKAFAITVFLWFNRIKNFFKGLADGFKAGIEAARPAIDGLLAAFAKLAAAFGFAQDGPDQARSKFEAFGKAGAKVGTVLAQIFEWLVVGVTKAISFGTGFVNTFNLISGGLSPLRAAFGKLWDAILKIVSALFKTDAAASGNMLTWEALGSAVGFSVGMIVGIVTGLVDTIATIFEIIGSFVEYGASSFAMLAAAIGKVVEFVTNIFHGDWAAAWQSAKDIVFIVVEGILDLVTVMVSGVAATADKIADAFGKDLGLKKKVEGFKDDLKTELKASLKVQDVELPAKPAAQQVAPTVSQIYKPPTVPNMQNMPSAAATQAQSANIAAITEAANKLGGKGGTTNVNLKSTLQVDGKVLAEIVQQHQDQDAKRGNAPVSPPT